MSEHSLSDIQGFGGSRLLASLEPFTARSVWNRPRKPSEFMQIQIDAVGGLAGDMFAAAMLDAFPQHEAGVLAAVIVATAASPVHCSLVQHNDGVLQGRRFLVKAPEDGTRDGELDQPHHRGAEYSHSYEADGRNKGKDHQHSHTHAAAAHAHRHWSAIRANLLQTELEPAVSDTAVAIFEHLARAEAQVHGIAVEDVVFHEVGAWDSIADIVAAAYLISATGARSWTVGALPLGSGRVRTAHGILPVPAPATAILLEGFSMIDDGIGGERITPTGAAILRYLVDRTKSGNAARNPRILGRSGIGFGTRVLPGISNCTRVLVFDEAATTATPGHRELAVIEFEVDDQTAEDLAIGLERLRAQQDIFDVVQMPVFGKKGRMMTHVRALARAGAEADAIAACFRETTTIGLRHHVVSGAALPRHATTVEVAGRPVRVKTVDRPGGRTAKAEADDALGSETHAARASLRRAAEQLALNDDKGP